MSKESILFDSSNLTLGLKDALHVPIVVVQCDELLHGGEWVRFVDAESNRVIKCDQDESHGFVNPYDTPFDNKPFIMFLNPDMTGPVRHEFDIKHKERETLEEELERQREEDPNCAECWQIENGKIIRW